MGKKNELNEKIKPLPLQKEQISLKPSLKYGRFHSWIDISFMNRDFSVRGENHSLKSALHFSILSFPYLFRISFRHFLFPELISRKSNPAGKPWVSNSVRKEPASINWSFNNRHVPSKTLIMYCLCRFCGSKKLIFSEQGFG
jgi:hypothetical protein